MSSIAVLHESARPVVGGTCDRHQTRVPSARKAETVAEMDQKDWRLAEETQVRLSPQDGGRLTDNWLLTFERPKYEIGDFILWHRPTQESESPLQTLPAIVMGQFDDGPYQLFVCSFQGAHMQQAPPEQLEPKKDKKNKNDLSVDLIRSLGGVVANLRGDIAKYGEDRILDQQLTRVLGQRIVDLESAVTQRLEALESAATEPQERPEERTEAALYPMEVAALEDGVENPGPSKIHHKGKKYE